MCWSGPPFKFPLFDLEVASNACATGVRFSDIVIGACLVFSMAERSSASYALVQHARFSFG